MTADEDPKEESEEEKLEAFTPRLSDELKLLGQRESYPDNARSFSHWAIRQLSPQLSERSIRSSILAGTYGSSARAIWQDRNFHDARMGLDGRLRVALFRWTEGGDPTGKELDELARELVEFVQLVSQG